MVYFEHQNKMNQFQEVVLSVADGYARLTIPQMIWMGFQGLGRQTNLVLNIANIEHSPEEIERKELDEIKFNWSMYQMKVIILAGGFGTRLSEYTSLIPKPMV